VTLINGQIRLPRPPGHGVPAPVGRVGAALIGLAGIAGVVLFLDPSHVGSALEHFRLSLIAPIVA
jgi:hypothetical protein